MSLWIERLTSNRKVVGSNPAVVSFFSANLWKITNLKEHGKGSNSDESRESIECNRERIKSTNLKDSEYRAKPNMPPIGEKRVHTLLVTAAQTRPKDVGVDDASTREHEHKGVSAAGAAYWYDFILDASCRLV